MTHLRSVRGVVDASVSEQVLRTIEKKVDLKLAERWRKRKFENKISELFLMRGISSMHGSLSFQSPLEVLQKAVDEICSFPLQQKLSEEEGADVVELTRECDDMRAALSAALQHDLPWTLTAKELWPSAKFDAFFGKVTQMRLISFVVPFAGY